ncbi:NADPH-dependent ferric siderophore reductase [Lysobacter enzymogenes]|uniref:siderophore-interacting protein n=1 Tax=Lysobacter enzymogenes TaxID=69 RepID=UPI0019D2B0FB|nr:siderophore-interacting protein [Lysobacter enzymogenes]MBN7135425.1 NADPH-dependent ferric siderophore reductase [Lysobacter enzymogenes]
MPSPTDLAVARVRHPLKLRELRVTAVESATPHLRRITLADESLADFVSASFDDHVKVFFPAPGEDRPVMPTLGPDGLTFAAGAARPAVRDFTPRRFDRDARELVLEFALHQAGPASDWARQAQVGQYLGIGGPRGSRVVPAGFAWHLLIGDDTALPAIARRLQELPAGVRAIALLEVQDASAQLEFECAAALETHWRYRIGDDADAESPLLRALRELRLPREDRDGPGYVWAAGESAAIRAVRQHLLNERGIDKARLHAAGYWKRGAQGVHETLDD